MIDSPALVTQATRRQLVVVIAVLGATATLGPAGLDLYMPGLPMVARELAASTSGVALTMTAFLIGMGVGMLFSGPLSDSFGRRRPMLIGLGIYALAALGCALAPSLGFLVAMRFALGMASSVGMAIGQAVIADYTRGARAARLMSRIVLVSSVAPILAPSIGAQLLRVTSWRGVFVTLAILGGVVLLTAFRFLRESLPRERRIASGPRTTLRTVRSLFSDLHFVGILATAALASTGFYAYLTGVSLVFQDVGGLSPTAFSILFTINAVGMLLSMQINHRLLARFSPRQLLGASLLIATVAAGAAVAVSFIQPLNVAALAVALFATVAPGAMLLPNAAALALSLHPETAGSAAAVFGASGMVLGSLATPLVGIGGTSALSMTLVMAGATVAGLVVYVVGPRRYPDNPEAAALEPQGEVYRA